MAHIRRLLDIVACATSFGSSSSSLSKPTGRPKSPKEAGPKELAGSNESQSANSTAASANADKKSCSAVTGGAQFGGSQGINEGSEKGGDSVVSLCPPPRLGQFYDFFSFSHLTPPIHCAFSVHSMMDL